MRREDVSTWSSANQSTVRSQQPLILRVELLPVFDLSNTKIMYTIDPVKQVIRMGLMDEVLNMLKRVMIENVF